MPQGLLKFLLKTIRLISWGGVLVFGVAEVRAQIIDADKAINVAEDSNTVVHQVLTKPTALSVLIEANQVVLTWDNSEEVILGYNVYRSALLAEAYELLPGQVGESYSAIEPRFVDSGLIRGEVYFYKVESVGETGKSAFSDAIEAVFIEEKRKPVTEIESFFKSDQPYISQLETRNVLGKRMWGIGLLLCGGGLVYQGFIFKDEADNIYAHYKDTKDPIEADRLFQQTSNRDIKGQVSWALGAAFAVAGLRLILSRNISMYEMPSKSLTLSSSRSLEMSAGVLPQHVVLRLRTFF